MRGHDRRTHVALGLAALALATLCAGCGKRYEVIADDCALVPPDAQYELSEASKESLSPALQRTVELRMIERHARDGEGPGVVVPKGTAIEVAGDQNAEVPDWTKLTVVDGPAQGKVGLVRRACLGGAGG